MNQSSTRAAFVATFAVLIFAAAGCSSIEKQETQSTEQMLAAAGFQMRLADTPQKLEHLKTLTQHKLVRHDKDGDAVYVYADATDCQCLYVGNQVAYGEYEKLDIRQNTAEMNEAASMDWGMWGPMGGGFGW